MLLYFERRGCGFFDSLFLEAIERNASAPQNEDELLSVGIAVFEEGFLRRNTNDAGSSACARPLLAVGVTDTLGASGEHRAVDARQGV